MSEEAWIREEPQSFTRVTYPSSSPIEMSFPPTRATSPTFLGPFRFGSRADHSQSKWQRDTHSPVIFSGARSRRASTQSKLNDKKEPAHANGSVDSPASTSSSLGPVETLSPSRYKTSSSSRPSTADPTTTRKTRGSLLVAASDALGFKFGRRKQPARQPPMPIILPDVIEIRAPRRDEEAEERNRLRDMAFQSIGIELKSEIHSLDDNVQEEDEEEHVDENGAGLSGTPEIEDRDLVHVRTWDTVSNLVTRSPLDSSASLHMSSSAVPNRYRSGSLLAHSRTNSVTLASVPSFPTTFAALTQFKQSATMLHKFYPSSSLRIFAMSKNWRNRCMVLSSPTALVTRNSAPPVSYLHLFKASSGDDKEMERLEINEDSVVFVAEEDVGGRKHVVKVGGVDVGALKKELNHEEGGRTMWFLHITDPAEAQKWINVIKTAILGQRTMRAGLGLPMSTLGGVEPRGDMDVMLSMRAQGLITSPTSTISPKSQNAAPALSQSDHNYASSISSHRSQATVARSISSGAVSTLKGLFTGSTRPRSASRATSIDSQDREPAQDESFASMGSHLLGSIRPNAADAMPGAHVITTHASLPYAGSVLSAEHRLERKIVTDRHTHWASIEPTPPVVKERATRTLSLGASLQPPPRKRWTSIGPTSQEHRGNSATDGTQENAETASRLSGSEFRTADQRARAPSLQSVSTFASAENGLSAERSSSSTKRSSKRWSRQGGVLPRRLTPPSGPPPSVPTDSANTLDVFSNTHAADRRSSQASSIHSAASQRSVVSNLPSFSKRASGSSFLSIPGSNASQSPSVSRPTSIQSHRLSMPPPPRPAPTFAPPLAPDQDGPKSDPFPSSKPSFRDSVAHRTFRRSMIAPKPPPSAVLPPRPDEVEFKTSHRRNSSAGSYTYLTSLDSIPASPIPAAHTLSPFPPPVGPLPPTPVTSLPAASPPPSRPVSRQLSLKRRLRILSAPSSSSGQSAIQALNGSTSPTRPLTATPVVPLSPPSTPIAEKITIYQNDPSFLQINTPVTPYLPPPRALPTPPEPYPEVTSLSPPPRRGSKQISVVEAEALPVEDEKPPLDGERRMMSLSRPGSVISLGIMSM